MLDFGKQNVIGVLVNAVDPEFAVSAVQKAATERRGFSVSALAVHGVMEGYKDEEHRTRLNALDLVVPDGQPVRWAMRALHGVRLPSRVYGPKLMLDVIAMAARECLPIYLYGSTSSVLEKLTSSLKDRFPELQIAGAESSKFRKLNSAEKAEVVERIKKSGARIVFVGLGCPRQEVWAFEYRDALQLPVLAVGAAFDFHAGTLPQAPRWMQDRGLEWLFRLRQEPKRLWRRYLILNPWYLSLLAQQKLHLRDFSDGTLVQPREISYG